jgi:type IV pilus assembly protein PilM
MLNGKSFLAIDFGAATLKVAEFQISEQGGLLLRNYGLRSLGLEGAQESTRQAAISRALSELLAAKPFVARNSNVCAPGFHTFSKFVKLPPADTSKVTQMIQYEAKNNVPFPLEDVVWDYQIVGSAPTGELEVFLVAVKTDVVEGLVRAAEAAGLTVQLVDGSPAALGNAFRYNYSDLEGCSMLLDIGAKTSNLLFIEKGNVFSRAINIGANAITQDFAKEARLSFDEAEKLKIEEGFVSLGGAYEEPDNPHAAAISKIARQVMTRLHIQVNQTMQFYRAQQGGSAPVRLFLAGGASVMPYTAQFFAEKLNLPEGVDYFNPFRNVQLDPSLNLEELAKVAHCMGEVVGLGLRNLARCPVELNLMPRSTRKRQQLRQKQPYFAASVGCLVLVLLAFGWFYNNRASEKQRVLEDIKTRLGPLQQYKMQLDRVMRELQEAQLELAQYTEWMQDRFYWRDICAALRSALMKVETEQEAALKAKVGVWIERLTPVVPPGTLMSLPASAVPGLASEPAFGTGLASGPGAGAVAPPLGAPPGYVPPEPGGAAAGPAVTGPGAIPSRAATTNEVTAIRLLCRGVNLTPVSADANTKLTYAVADAFRAQSNLFSPETELVGQIKVDGDPGSALTFTFEVLVKLRRPIKL